MLILSGCGIENLTRPVPTTMPGGISSPFENSYVVTSDNRPVAQLQQDQPDLLSGGSVDLPDGEFKVLEGIKYPLSASLAYTGTGGTLLVDTLIKSSPIDNSIMFGERIFIESEFESFIKTYSSDQKSTRIIMINDEIIIVISSNISRDRLLQLSRLIYIRS